MRFYITPVRLTVLSYVFLIFFGTLLLALPIATQNLEPMSFIDALFTATSAVCVTGLIVQDTGVYFSTFGQLVILSLIQLGGLGIMTLYASLPVVFGKQVKLSERSFLHEIVQTHTDANLASTLASIVKYTFIIELIGSLILTVRFYILWGDWGRATYYGVFHAISAFCNAGFSLFTNSFISYSGDAIINFTIMILVVLGGLGFVVLREVIAVRSFRKFSPHSKLVLTMTALLIFIPSFFVFHLEFTNAFAEKGMLHKVYCAFFQVIMTRTAGFNSVDIASMQNITLFLFIIMMFVGAAPGGTAGGVKISTVGLLFISLRSIMRGQTDIEIYKKRVPPQVVTKSIAIIVISFSIVTFFVMMLLLTETGNFLPIFFEVISAFGTVGLSLGVTAKLSVTGKFFISLLMLIGRIGSLTLIFLIRSHVIHPPHYRYPWGRFMVG